MIHAMIDLETLDVTPQASVLTVGGVKFIRLMIVSLTVSSTTN